MTREESLNRLKKIVEDARTAMLVTQEGASLRSRPMHTAKIESDHSIYFFTSKDSDKVEDIQQDRYVNLSYIDSDSQNFLSISGTAHLVTDRQKMEELWSPMMKAWYPEGLDTPELTLLKIEPDEAALWSASSSKLVQAFQIGKAIITGERYQSGVHEEISY
ncbi:MAG: pyridoxamine 5'-phosphate oxidase family protein [Bacteroidota bacterium]